MGKRCETVNNGEPCFYLASDGTCLLPRTELANKCPARETVSRESKDDWMKVRETVSRESKDDWMKVRETVSRESKDDWMKECLE